MKPLVIKCPSNVYRLYYLQKLFPYARMRIVHLTRHPGAVVQGLLDGWHHRGFFSHRVSFPLDIAGYSDRYPTWGSHWWNFDLFPGWQKYADEPLADVCAMQWQQAHEKILAATSPSNRVSLCFEEVVNFQRRITFRKLLEKLDLDAEENIVPQGPLPIVMATQPPNPNRWLNNPDVWRVLNHPKVRETAHLLGYC